MAEINPKYLRIDIYSNSSMPSARYKDGIDNVRITHLITGAIATCDSQCLEHEDEKTIDARACAMKNLKEIMGVS